MKRKFILGILIALSIFVIGCNKVENEVNKEVIVIDEDTKETIEKNKSLSLNLKFQGYIELTNQIKSSGDEYEFYYLLEDSIFRFILLNYKEDPMEQFGSQNIVKVEMKKIEMGSRNEDLTIGEWTELDIKGELVPGGLGVSRTFKIRNNDKVYELLNDGNLSEVEAYNEVYSEFKELPFSEEVYNSNLNTFPLDGFNNWGIADEEKNEYFEIRNTDKVEEIYENHFRIFEAEDDKVYIYTKKPVGEDFELIIGYLENDKFFNLFENEDFTIINQGDTNLSYGSVIKNGDSILFSGIIDKVNGIWNYNLETKKLTLQMEIEKGFVTGDMLISPTKENLIITNYKIDLTNSSTSQQEKEENIIYSLAELNENLEIKEIIDITEKDKEIQFDKFSSDGKKLYLQYFNEEENRRIFEIYEITN